MAHDDLRALLQSLEIHQAQIVGHSGGGVLALDFALTYPEMVSSLILFAPGVSGYDWSNMGDYLAQMDAYYERNEIANMVNFAFQTWVVGPHRKPNQVAPTLGERIRGLMTDQFSRSMEKTEGGMLEPPAIARLGEIQLPTLVVIGEEDHPELHKVANLLTSDMINATKTIIPSGAHMVNMEQPTRFNQVIPVLVLNDKLQLA